jgi:hypothetical protein
VSFSPDWLALREPADHRARNPILVTALARRFAGRDSLAAVELGCGTGSNLRALAPVLPGRQSWRLVDHDPALLAAARERLAAWADGAREAGAGLELRKGDRTIRVAFDRADLAADPAGTLGAAHLVTAAALFDLVSPAFIGRLAPEVAAREAVFYTALTYDGVEIWEPPHAADAAVLAAFHAHQEGDKGFGPAAGKQATEVLARAFLAQGYRVRSAGSPWRLGAGDAPLVRALAEGAATAVRETGRVEEAVAAAWLAARRAAASCTIGHQDLLAFPGRSSIASD